MRARRSAGGGMAQRHRQCAARRWRGETAGIASGRLALCKASAAAAKTIGVGAWPRGVNVNDGDTVSMAAGIDYWLTS